ncbi:MAG: permease [FCB group bacterium]|nr:permease [FCB group bacterium]
MVNRKKFLTLIPALSYSFFILYSVFNDFQPGIAIWENFETFLIQIAKLLPFVFILIGLFEVWVKRETIDKHLGENSGFMSFVWGIMLAGTTVGGLYVALPVAHSLYLKGARTSVVLTYISAGAIFRVPMTLFEAGFLGWKFTIIRLAVSLPLVIISSVLLGKYLDKNDYVFPTLNRSDSFEQRI